MDIPESPDIQIMYATAIVSFIGAITYCIKKTADSGIAFRSNCCKGSVEIDLDTNQGSPRNFYREDPPVDDGSV